MNKLICIFFLLFASFGSNANEESYDNTVYSFGVVPQFDARRIYSIWRPILDELQLLTGLHFVLRGSANIPDFKDEFMGGEFDFAYMNPYQVVLASQSQNYEPVVRDIGRKLHGIVVVQKDSDIQTLDKLDGETMAFPAPGALGATLLVRSEFQDKYGINVKPRFVQTHSSVYLNVAIGEMVAGGGVQKTLAQQPAEVRNALRVLYRTQEVAPHPVVSHPRVSPTVREKVQAAFLKMGENERTRQMLSKIPIKHVGAASMVDYEPLVNMNLDRFK